MPALTVKNIPDNLYQELKYVAKLHHRSINSEVIACLEHAFLHNQITPEQRLKNAQTLRAKIQPDIITEKDIMTAIGEGRP